MKNMTGVTIALCLYHKFDGSVLFSLVAIIFASQKPSGLFLYTFLCLRKRLKIRKLPNYQLPIAHATNSEHTAFDGPTVLLLSGEVGVQHVQRYTASLADRTMRNIFLHPFGRAMQRCVCTYLRSYAQRTVQYLCVDFLALQL